jgi:hypothetical protein
MVCADPMGRRFFLPDVANTEGALACRSATHAEAGHVFLRGWPRRPKTCASGRKRPAVSPPAARGWTSSFCQEALATETASDSRSTVQNSLPALSSAFLTRTV